MMKVGEKRKEGRQTTICSVSTKLAAFPRGSAPRQRNRMPTLLHPRRLMTVTSAVRPFSPMHGHDVWTTEAKTTATREDSWKNVCFDAPLTTVDDRTDVVLALCPSTRERQ